MSLYEQFHSDINKKFMFDILKNELLKNQYETAKFADCGISSNIIVILTISLRKFSRFASVSVH